MYSTDLKLRAIELYKKFNSYRYIENLLKIGKSTVHRWVNNINNISNKKLVDINKLVEFIHKLLLKDSFITLLTIKNKIFDKFKQSFSLSFIHTIIIKKLKFSYKKVNHKLFHKSIDDLFLKQKQFLENIKSVNKDNIICIDETYIHSNYFTSYGWCQRNKRLMHFKKSNPIKYSMLMAISNKKIINYEIYKCNVDKIIFANFMRKLNNKFVNHHFLMDNVSFHKTKLITDILSSSSNKLLYIPPYSPQFNPIEEVFSQLKRNLRQFNKCTIIQKIIKSISLISSINLLNYYRHSFD